MHIERYSILLSKNFDKIIAIEPSKGLFNTLKLNIKLNKLEDKVTLLDVALGDKNKGRILKSCGNFSSLLDPGPNKKYKLEKVKVRKLDDLIKELSIRPYDISLIKIDVEGFEYHVLKGMENILKYKPILVIEI